MLAEVKEKEAGTEQRNGGRERERICVSLTFLSHQAP